MLYPEGLTNRNGNKLAKSTVERMFKNIFYIIKFKLMNNLTKQLVLIV